ncbi:AAA domain-containing protein [Amycolatopsis sp. NPDC059657]|uniref:AAA domain-containing protein n=1 Tax=Amycolatopsis sp. NPDC059657 TaxID=3346899 RepID=UPI00366F09DB
MRPNDPNVRREAIKLVQYLRDMAASTKADSCDLDDFERCWWLSELPGGLELRTQLAPDGGLLTVDQVPLPPPPDLPPQLNGHVEHQQWVDHDLKQLDLSEDLTTRVADAHDATDLTTAYRTAVAARDAWLAEVKSVRPQRTLYEDLRQVAGQLANQDDEFELVLCAGLVSGSDENGRLVRRHLLVKRLFARVDDRYSGVTVGPDTDAIMLMEDRRFLIPVLGERLGSADHIRAEVEQSDLLPTDEGASKWLSDWSGRLLPDSPRFSDAVTPPTLDQAGRLTVSASPAIVLRRRDRSSVAGFLDRVLEQLRDPGVVVPQALVQILRDLTPDEQEAWLAAVAGGTKSLGAEPLFSREHNLQQRLVLDRVRQDNGAVVQGPPGTGKTHTIANFLVAMLAEGMRVLVVSQREQPLRVLRGMLPPDMQKLCVSLAGSKDGRASELESSVRAMAEYLASTTNDQAQHRVATSHERWLVARQRVADIQVDLAVLRESEHVDHPSVSDGYRGRLADIAAQVQERRGRLDWFPSLAEHSASHSPLTPSELTDLRTLLIEHPLGPQRAMEFVPPPDQIHTPEQAEVLFNALRPPHVRDGAAQLADLCGRIDAAELDRWLSNLTRLNQIVRHLQQRANVPSDAQWLTTAVDDLLSGRNFSAWHDVIARSSVAEALSARSRNPLLRDVHFPEHDHTALRDLRDEAWKLRQGLATRQPVRTALFRRLTLLGRDTQVVRERCRYRGREPRTREAAAAVHDVLDIVVTLAEAEHAWSFVVAIPTATAHAGERLRWLVEAEAALPVLRELGQITSGMRTTLAKNGILAVLTTHDLWLTFHDAVTLARHRIDAAQHEQYHTQLNASWAAVLASPEAAPELGELAAALEHCDILAFRTAADAVNDARRTIESHCRLRELHDRMTEGHAELVTTLTSSLLDNVWETRFPMIDEAWSWAIADRFVHAQYRPGLDAQRESDLAEAKADLLKVTAELATAKAWANCLQTMDPKARRGLKNYEHFAKKQRGRGANAARYQKSARSAIADAKPAVPAWVMTIDRVAELFPAAPNSFDVVIVDEASQAEPTALFLLWLAPRVIVVGDDKQCTPYSSPRLLDGVIDRLRADFPDVPSHVREVLLPNGNLYNILSSAFPAVVRLREHFRCMPEIISWPSRQFYDDDLVPLRQHGANRLEPVLIGHVPNGQTTGSSETLTNRPEAEYVIDRLAKCLDDPAYEGKTFGIIAVQSARQVKMLTGLLHKRIPASEIERRNIRVGNAQNFQGDERDVMLVSTVVAGRPQILRNDTRYEQRINVAVSRARDQLWLITSLGPDLDSEDIRHRMLSHYSEIEEIDQTEDFDHISPTQRCEPFRSLFVQQVYLAIRHRGYAADPHQDIGGRQLDIVVRGQDRSVAVMCDEYTGLSAERRRKDDESLRELRRAGWPFCRVAHSQFILAPSKALEVVWQILTEHGVEPQEA